MKGLETWFKGRSEKTAAAIAAWLTPAMIVALLAGHADVQADSPTACGKAVANALCAESSAISVIPSDGEAGVDLIADPTVDSNGIRSNASIDAGFNVRFEEAIQAFAEKGVVTRDEFDALEKAARARSFTVAGLTDQYALEQIKGSVQKAIEAGQMPNDWLTNLEQDFSRMGLSGVGDNAWHMRLVFRQNVNTAYAAGRYRQMQQVKKSRPYWTYVTVGDDHVRPEHAALDGVTKPADDPFWKKYYPPNGFGCRCLVVSVSEDEMTDEGLAVTEDAQIADRYQQLQPSAMGMPRVPEEFQVDPAEAFGLSA